MSKIKLLTATAIVGVILTGCQLPKLPEIKKQEKAELTKSECDNIIKKLEQLNNEGFVGNEPSLGRDYALEAHVCKMKYYSNQGDIDIEKIMEINK